MERCELWIKIADNGLIVKECDDEGIVCSTIVMEGDNAPMGLGKLILEYLLRVSAWNDEYHIKMDIK
jgi:hypothetical protein